jgi:hypothetical protein
VTVPTLRSVLPKDGWIARRSRPVKIAIVSVVVLAIAASTSAVAVVSTGSTTTVAATVADWGRDHGLNWLVSWLESVQYEADQPAVGGTPAGGIPVAAGVVEDTTPPAPPLPVLTGGTPLPGEGRWQTVVDVKGKPAVQVTALRPDEQHTSFVVGVMRIDPKLVRGELHPGTEDPGGPPFKASTSLAGAAGAGVVAAFNGGFRLSDPSHPGFYAEGRTARPLVDGAASLVLHTDGTADVGAWNREVRMAPDVVSVRQNLLPLVDGGVVSPTCATGGTKEWGSTIGQAAYIHRSGFGVTATGVEVYVGGPALSVCTLGRILTDAGVVRGMELDINPHWVTGTYFHDRPGAAAQGFSLFPAEQAPPQHYFTPSARDWYSWHLRTK